MDVNKRFNEHDEVSSDMLKTLDQINTDLAKMEKRLDLSIKRMVMAETRLEKIDRRFDENERKSNARFEESEKKSNARFEESERKSNARFEAGEKRMEVFDKKLEQSIHAQTVYNRIFLKQLEKLNKKLGL